MVIHLAPAGPRIRRQTLDTPPRIEQPPVHRPEPQVILVVRQHERRPHLDVHHPRLALHLHRRSQRALIHIVRAALALNQAPPRIEHDRFEGPVVAVHRRRQPGFAHIRARPRRARIRLRTRPEIAVLVRPEEIEATVVARHSAAPNHPVAAGAHMIVLLRFPQRRRRRRIRRRLQKPPQPTPCVVRGIHVWHTPRVVHFNPA